MSKPHSEKKRPPEFRVPQLGQAAGSVSLARSSCCSATSARPLDSFSKQILQVLLDASRQSAQTACLQDEQIVYSRAACWLASANACSLALRDPSSEKLSAAVPVRCPT